MNALEIVATVVLSIIGLCTVLLWGKVTLLIDKISKRYDSPEQTPNGKRRENDK